MAKIYEVAIRLAGKLSGGFTRSFSQASEAVRGLGSDLDKLAAKQAKLAKLQKSMTKNAPYATGAGAVMGAGLATSVSTGMDFEAQISKVGAVSRASADDMAKLEAQARKLGESTAWSATQAAEGMQFLAMAGFKTNEIMGAMPGMLSLASAAGIELGDAADISSNILTGFGMKAEEMGKAADVLVNTFTTSNTDLKMLGQSMKYVAPVAKSFGADIYTTAGLVGKLGDAGIQADQAGTSLRMMMVRMAKPTKMVKEAMDKVGISFKDSHGNMKPMNEILREMQQKTEKLTQAERMEVAAKIFGTEALSAGMVLMEKANEKTAEGKYVLDEYIESLHREGSAQETSDRMLDNLAGKTTLFKSALEGLQLVIYQQVSPALKDFVENATQAVGRITDWTKEHPELTKALVIGAGAIAGIAAAALPMVAAFKTAAFVLGLVKGAMLAVNIAMTANPIGLVVAAVAGLTVGFVLLWQNCEGFRNFFISMWDGICSAAKGAVNILIGALNKIIDGMNSLFSFSIPDWVPGVGGQGWHMDLKPIAMLAAGGIATGPTPAIIGEGREPEAVLPLSKLAGMLGGSAGGMGGMSVNFAPVINISGDGGDAYAQVKRGLSEGRDTLRRELERLMSDQRRLSYV